MITELTNSRLPVDVLAHRPDPVDNGASTTSRSARHLTLLFALSLAVPLPPAALQAPSGPASPTVHSEPRPIIDPLALAAVLDRSITEVGRGRVALGEVDTRLRGLVVSLDVCRVAEPSGALVCLGVVRPDPTAPGFATAADLWGLARGALAQYAVAWEPLVGIGEAAFLKIHGGQTAQVAWMTGDRLATASVTCLAGVGVWAIEAARSLAVLSATQPAPENSRDSRVARSS